jgi:hypothetical protein
MPELPRDVTDLALAPVAIAVDEMLRSYEGLDRVDIDFRLALETDRQPRSLEARASAVLETITRSVNLRGWEPAWCDRGLTLRHGEHTLTIGLPAELRDYLALGELPRPRLRGGQRAGLGH